MDAEQRAAAQAQLNVYSVLEQVPERLPELLALIRADRSEGSDLSEIKAEVATLFGCDLDAADAVLGIQLLRFRPSAQKAITERAAELRTYLAAD
ncbi:hypothetical protein ACXJJ3_30595 [Kribbella sp. WER1]